MSPVWYGPYFSAAANFSWGGEFRYSLEEVKAFRELSAEEQRNYRFSSHDDLSTYVTNSYGLVYFIAAAKKLFYWRPDVQALESLQVTLHAAFSLAVLALLDSRWKKLLFLVFYGVNPIVVHYVTYPFYYFYQCLPSLALILLLLARKKWHRLADWRYSVTFVAMCLLLALVLVTRPTTIAPIGAFFVLAWLWVPSRRLVLGAFAAFAAVAVTGYIPSQQNVWHPIYIGIGAYPNPYMRGLSDENGYALFEEKTGTKLDASLGGNYYDGTVLAEYRALCRDEYLRILVRDWPRLVGNAALNTLQGYSIGYLVGRDVRVHYLVAASGLLFLIMLLAANQRILALLIALTVVTFAPYFPPIPAYMFGAYALQVIGGLAIAEHFAGRLAARRSAALMAAPRG